MLESLTTPTTTEGSFTLRDNNSHNNNNNYNKRDNSNRQQQQQQSSTMNKKEIYHIPSININNSNSHKKQRNYELFEGKSTFFCGGRLMTSQAYWAFIIALILLITPCVLFAVFVCPFLWFYLHPIIPIIFAYVFVLAIVSMFKASWTDPGVIPRGLDPTPTLETFDDHSSIWTQPFPADKCVKIKDEMWNLKYCDTCKIYRPPRASHCRQCDNCVENEDHHCIWLNNCIGKRNYRPFFTFILSIIGFILLWMVGGLTCYHCYLVVKGLTTHEKVNIK
ncbi:DHHC palmitoyltransferase-domain-containing protein [Cunninghamella echinulata]|nr:DHHC palmitoyltransferase-domain-containing protein [Cunninghamella echinulata]